MSNLSTEAIVTIISTIPGLLVSTLSAWFAYKALCRRDRAPHDVETLTLELALVQFDPASRISSAVAPQSMATVSSHSSRHRQPPPPLLPPVVKHLPGAFQQPQRVEFPETSQM